MSAVAETHVSSNAKTLRAIKYMFFPGGGIGRYTHEVATELHKIPELDLELACLEDFEFLPEAKYKSWPHLMQIRSGNKIVRKAKFLTAQVVSPKRVLKRVRETGADVLHLANINHLSFPIWRRWLQKSDVKIVATAHDVRRSKAIIHRGWETNALRSFYEMADALFIHSQQQKDDLMDFAKVDEGRIHQVPMGTMPYAERTADKAAIRSRLGIGQDRTVALFFGNIRDDKNLHGLLTAMSLQADPFFLIIAGRAGGAGNKKDSWYKALINDLGLQGDVLYLDRFIENEEIGDLFEAADFIPLCYLESFTSQSAVLNVAMHYEKPVIATPAPTLAETVKQFDIGVLTDSDKPEDLVDGVERLMANIGNKPAFGFDEYKRRNSWAENARITFEVYHSLLN